MPRIVISAERPENIKELEKLHKKINLWRVKKGGDKPLSVLAWAKQAHEALELCTGKQ